MLPLRLTLIFGVCVCLCLFDFQVSAQPHYDFGMRAIKSVLVMAGTGKRSNPDLPEAIVMIRAMCDSNIPKFLKEDVVLFNAIVQVRTHLLCVHTFGMCCTRLCLRRFMLA